MRCQEGDQILLAWLQQDSQVAAINDFEAKSPGLLNNEPVPHRAA